MNESERKLLDKLIDFQRKELKKIVTQVSESSDRTLEKSIKDLGDLLYTQIESLTWLQRRLSLKNKLPPLRGWATSPDVLVLLHEHIMNTRPKVVVEIGSGASTLVIADALRQNGEGILISIEHSEYYGAETLKTLVEESLDSRVDIRIGELEKWDAFHLNPSESKKQSFWYPRILVEDIKGIELLWVDGPPGITCKYCRYPALPAVIDKLAPLCEVWMDDTIRQEEKAICERWSKDYGFDLKYYPLEKGLGRLLRKGAVSTNTPNTTTVNNKISFDSQFNPQIDTLDFSLSKSLKIDKS